MIRRDYIMRMVQEMVQVLVRAVLLKSRREYDQALAEIHAALQGLVVNKGGTAGEMSLEDWINLCRAHEHAASGLTSAVAELLREQGEVLALQGQAAASQKSRQLALGLLLDALLTGDTFVSAESLAKVEELIQVTKGEPRPAGVWRRLLGYFSARGRFADAEDALFDWVATGDRDARSEGELFYEQLLRLSDDVLAQGNLPRAEVEEGLRELHRAVSGW